MDNGRYNELAHLGYKPTYNWGAPSCSFGIHSWGQLGLAATPPGFPSLVAPAAAPRALDGAAPLAALGREDSPWMMPMNLQDIGQYNSITLTINQGLVKANAHLGLFHGCTNWNMSLFAVTQGKLSLLYFH